MNISANISNNIKKYRKELGLSQEGLAERLNLTSQAVSKWECMQSIPDIESIISLCELFGITTDKLLLDKDPEVQYIEVERESAKAERENTFYFSGVPDDSKLRVLQFKGRKWIQENEYDPDVYIPIRINEGITLFNRLYVEIRGNVKFNGSRVDGNVSCGNVVAWTAQATFPAVMLMSLIVRETFRVGTLKIFAPAQEIFPVAT